MHGGLSRRDLFAAGAPALGMGLGAAGLASCRAAAPAATPDPTADAERAARLDELLADLTDASHEVAPIAPEERADRRRRLARLCAEHGADAYLVEPGATLDYLAGVSWGRSERLFALVVPAEGEPFWIVPAFEAGRAELLVSADGGPGGAIVPWDEHEYAFAPLAAELDRRRIERVALDPGLRYVFAVGLARERGAWRVLDGSGVLVALRGAKDAHELLLLRRANELTQRAIASVARTLEPGLAGRDVAERMAHAHRRLGMRSPWCLALVGPEAALPHGGLNELVLEPGSLLLVDTGATLHGYHSDNTRTWVVGGEPEARLERVWNTVRDAQQRAFDAVKPGVPCSAVDRVARDVIDAAGFGPGYRTFTHRLGHGIGMEGHEAPYFDGGSDTVLVPGMTLSDEPGIYLPGELGVRIEDIVAVTEDGADHFGTWQRSVRAPD